MCAHCQLFLMVTKAKRERRERTGNRQAHAKSQKADPVNRAWRRVALAYRERRERTGKS
jgi:hypothetical protein